MCVTMDAQEQTDDPLVMLYVPCGSEPEAASLAVRLLSDRLIACANIYASRSLYMWKGEMADEEEMVLVCKTLAPRADAATSLIKQAHSYDVPCILRIMPAEANKEFYRWVSAELAPPVAPEV